MPLFISGSNGVSGADGTAALPAVQGTDGDTGVFFPAANQVAIATGGVQRLLVDASGNVTTSVGSLYPLVTTAAVASTSGTSIDFTGIPSWVRRITVMLDSVSTNGSSNLLLQLGTSSGIDAANYRGTAFYPGATYALLTSGVILIQGGAAANIAHGSISFSFVTGNTWAGAGTMSFSNAAAIGLVSFAKTLGGVLDRVRVTTVAGTDTFDGGNINIQYE